MNNHLGFLGVLLSSTILVACGGGGGGGGSADSQAGGGTDQSNAPGVVVAVNPELAKYAGIWRKDCVDHMRLTMTATATGTNAFSVTRNEEHFANPDCTGEIVAVGNYGVGVPDEAVTYTAPLENASILMPSGATIVATVDPGTAVSATAQFSFTGSGVLASVFDPILGQTVARIKYAEKEVILERAALIGQSDSGALLLLNDELFSLVLIENSTSSFRVNHRFFR
jgi:hypothetical protein